MKYVMMALLALSFTACSPSSSNDNKSPVGGAGGGVGQSDAPQKNETNYGVCGNYTPTNQDIEGAWQMTHSQGEFAFTMTLDFYRGYITASNDCSFRGRNLRAQIEVPASYGNGRIRISYGANRTERIDESGFNMDCSVSVEPTSMIYSFRGRCLVLSQTGSNQELVMVPR